jgi:hypothetical protein
MHSTASWPLCFISVCKCLEWHAVHAAAANGIEQGHTHASAVLPPYKEPFGP